MKLVQVYNSTRPLAGPLEAIYADSFGARLRGLTFRRTLPAGLGLVLVQNRLSRVDSAIHMLGVWFELAVIWLDAQHKIVDTRLAKPWRLFYVPKRPAQFVLETAAVRLPEFETGDQLKFDHVETP